MEIETQYVRKMHNNAVFKTGLKNEILEFNNDDISDEDLLGLFLNQQIEHAFDVIVKRYENYVYGLAYRILKNHTLAEDVFQEVFLILSSKLSTFRNESKFSTWLYRITLNVCYAYRKKEFKHYFNISVNGKIADDNRYDYDEILQDTNSNEPDQETSQSEILEIIENEIGQLPEKYRIVCILRDIEGLTNPEVSQILNISVSAVKSRILRARNILKIKLNDLLNIES